MAKAKVAPKAVKRGSKPSGGKAAKSKAASRSSKSSGGSSNS